MAEKKIFLFSFLYLFWHFFKEMLILSDECSFTEEVTLDLGLNGCVGV